MKAKIDTPQGKQIYARRLAIVEPVFANICIQKKIGSLYLAYQIQGGCAVEVICPGAQYRQNP
jgi:hypothetical protein